MPRACFFEYERIFDLVESFSDVTQFVLRMLAEKNEFYARGAPAFLAGKFQFFREIFARISRDLDAECALFRI